MEKFEEDTILSGTLLEKKTFIQTELLRIIKEEELYWHKRSNSKWLLDGDNNTEFFNRIANGRKRKNTIFSTMNIGSNLEDEAAILDHATQYFKNLFGPSDCPSISLDPLERM